MAVILALAALPALAQDNDPQLAELEALYRQLTDIKKKIADVRVEMGQITAEQGTAIKERADEHYNWLKENSFRCPGCGLGGGWRRGALAAVAVWRGPAEIRKDPVNCFQLTGSWFMGNGSLTSRNTSSLFQRFWIRSSA